MTEEDQPGERKAEDSHTPIPPPYTPDDLVNNIQALNLNEQDELMDRIMDEPGF